MNILDKVMMKLGYYRPVVGKGSKVSQTEIEELFRTYGQTEVFRKFLDYLCERDKELYFQASTDSDREKVRGAFQRTSYFISLIQKSNARK